MVTALGITAFVLFFLQPDVCSFRPPSSNFTPLLSPASGDCKSHLTSSSVGGFIFCFRFYI